MYKSSVMAIECEIESKFSSPFSNFKRLLPILSIFRADGHELNDRCQFYEL